MNKLIKINGKMNEKEFEIMKNKYPLNYLEIMKNKYQLIGIKIINFYRIKNLL